MEYTKGEWKVIQKKASKVPFFDGFTLSVEGGKLLIALCDREKWDNKKQRLANAHLIAAAPDAYKELKEAYDMGLFDGCDDIQFNRIKQALAKAEGR